METVITYPGPPKHSHFAVNDVVTDCNGIDWFCTVAGKADSGGTAQFASSVTPAVAAPTTSGDTTGATDFASLTAYAQATAGKAASLAAGDYYINGQVTFTSPFLVGQGMQNTRIHLVGKFGKNGASDYAKAGIVLASVSSGVQVDIFARDFSVTGPYTSQTVNDSYDNTSTGGIEVQGKGTLQNVGITNCMDGLITNTPQGHLNLVGVVSNKNFNNVRWFSYHGDHCYIDCDFNLPTFCSTYIDAACDIIESHTELRVHRGFGPAGIVQDASNTLRMFRDCDFQFSKFEAIGNECIVYLATQPTGSHSGGWGGVRFQNPTVNANGTYQRTSGTPALTSTGYGVVMGALEDDNFVEGHSTFETIALTMPIADQGQGRLRFFNGTGAVTNPTIINNASNPAPKSSWLYLGGQSARGSSRPARQGFIDWSFDPALLASNTAPTSGILYLVQLSPSDIEQITKISWFLTAQGSSTGGWTATSSCMALYDCGQTTPGTATLLQSVDVTAALAAASANTEIVGTITAVQGYPDGDVFAAFLPVYTWATAPTFGRGGSVSGAISDIDTQLVPRFGTFGTGQTTSTLPTTISIASIAKASQAWWAGIR